MKLGTKALRALTKEERANAIRYAVAACGSLPAAAKMLGTTARTLERLARADPSLAVGARGRGKRARRAKAAGPESRPASSPTQPG